MYLKTRKRWIFRKHKRDLRQNPTMFVEID
nr:MAG TPA: hypothetical protein [Caudoviricetes sp.]